MYLFHTYFKKNTLTFKALLKITGIGERMSIQTCDQIGISQHIALEDLSALQFAKFNQTIHKNLLADNDFRVYTRKKIKQLISISSYRGVRHLEGLPCRGQRTHTNACTSRRKRNKNTQKNKT